VRNYIIIQSPTFNEAFLSKIIKIQWRIFELQLKMLGIFLCDTVYMQQTCTCTGYITTEWADIKERVQILYVQPCAELFNLLIGGGGCRTPTYLCAIAWLADSAVVHWLSRVWRARSSRWTELTNDRPITALIIDCLHGRATMAVRSTDRWCHQILMDADDDSVWFFHSL